MEIEFVVLGHTAETASEQRDEPPLPKQRKSDSSSNAVKARRTDWLSKSRDRRGNHSPSVFIASSEEGIIRVGEAPRLALEAQGPVILDVRSGTRSVR